MSDMAKAEDEVLNPQKSGKARISEGHQDFKKGSTEEEILRFWAKNKIYEKVRKQNAKGKKFFFMDGPPYATGHIHMGTALNKILKDIAIRYRTLNGFDVFDRPGYDTHGLPIEFQVEKEIGSKSKKDIEKYGVKKFIDKCREYATKYIGVMNDEFANLGVWMDWSDPYLTLDDEYIEAVWYVLKKTDEKGLLYLGKYPVHLCPRCETAVAYNEIEYTKQSDNSVYIKFPVKGKKDKFLIIFTTTPWTLPANTGIMVHPTFSYSEIETSDGERWIVATELVDKVMTYADKKYKKVREFKGKEIEGLEYSNPIAKNTKIKVKNGNRVVLSGRYVNAEEGTGLVHCAPGHGKEDYEVGKENGLDIICPVKMNGEMSDEAGKYAGKKAREVDAEIIADLEKEEVLVYKGKYTHDYPVCWRCKSPLLMVSLPQWFLKISDVHKKLLKENEETRWVPDYMKLRMKAWLEGINDWPISRERYWGTPLPIWVNDDGDTIVIGSINELEELTGKKVKDLHKPEIDKLIIKKKGKEYRRISAVLDVWIDSGVTSWATLRYPGEKDKFEKYWPADLNIEGTDQFRGWWNSQLILSTIGFEGRPFNNIAVHGLVLDVDKRKMSKSVGNIISPKDIIEKYSRDYLRYYFAKLSRGEDFAFDEREFKEIGNLFRVLLNVNNFVDQLTKEGKETKEDDKIEDSWITSKYNNLIKEATKSFDECKFYEAVGKIEKFLIQDLSRNYIQMIRERADEASSLLKEIRLGILKLIAPVSPFMVEKIWRTLKKEKIVKEDSLFLSSWPKSDEKKINADLEEDFVTISSVIESGLAERDKNKIGLRWPLAKAIVTCDLKLNEQMKEIIARQLNVKKVELKEGKAIEVVLDLNITDELEAEGFAREIARRVQAERRERGLQKSDKIDLKLSVDSKLKDKLDEFVLFLKERTGSTSVKFIDGELKKGFEFLVKDKKIVIAF